MRIFQWLLFFLPFCSLSVMAQLTYTFQNDIPVTEDNITLDQPFSGGLVAPQYSAIDIDLDGINDLFVFDRASNKVSTFLFKDEKYIYSPQYESLFPAGLKSWVLLRDYNCDGKVDIFTSSLFGMSLYENISVNELSWDLKYQTIYTEGSNGQTNLQISSLDLPAIIDVDDDGDLDILNFNFATGGGIEFHKNMSIENGGVCDIDLVRTTKKYGDFEECTCETYVFGTDECPTGGREAHSGGRSILSFKNSSTIAQDLIIGQEYCLFPGYLPNSGTSNEPKMTNVSFDFPDPNHLLRIEYPAIYEVDIFNDGIMNLIAAPNSYVADGTQNYEEHSYLYGKNNQGDYNLVSDNFLKKEMIDVGHKVSPVFVDIDFDGDEDLLVGAGKIGEGASIWLYKNTGSPKIPSFDLITKDYLSFKVDGIESIRVQAHDVDNNGFHDLILYKVIGNELVAEAFLHTGNPITPYSKTNSTVLNLPELSIWDSPHYFVLGNQTGLLIGKQDGNLEYYTTSGELTTGSWQLISGSYLGIDEDFTKRNLRAVVGDFDGNGKDDMLSSNDAGEVLIYKNFISENTPQNIKGITDDLNLSFDLNFGRIANPTFANIYGTLEPSLVFGLLQGGLNLLKNTQATEGGNTFSLEVVTYPNPVESKQIILQANKNSTVRVLDSVGKVVLKSHELARGEPVVLQLVLLEGIYFIEVTSSDKEKKVNRIVIVD